MQSDTFEDCLERPFILDVSCSSPAKECLTEGARVIDILFFSPNTLSLSRRSRVPTVVVPHGGGKWGTLNRLFFLKSSVADFECVQSAEMF